VSQNLPHKHKVDHDTDVQDYCKVKS